MIPERKILVITGAGGFLGKGLIRVLEGMYTLRMVDIRDFETPHEKRIGDVADPDFCMEVMKGAHLLLIAHMSPRPYDTPYGPFNVNVTGTANLLFAAQANSIKRACIISSVDAVHGEIKRNGKKHSPSLRPSSVDIYGATKACQEIVAEMFHYQYGLDIAALRIGYVVDCNSLINKYGTHLERVEGGMIDPTDCGTAISRIFALPELGYRVWYLYSACDKNTPEGLPARRKLNWTPKYMEKTHPHHS